ncbi:hypothetical protein GCM10010182_61360 [Actinomadura cremea]|nr:hypothetical protein GCM10010182_61360 [Actinomadura cremea]
MSGSARRTQSGVGRVHAAGLLLGLTTGTAAFTLAFSGPGATVGTLVGSALGALLVAVPLYVAMLRQSTSHGVGAIAAGVVLALPIVAVNNVDALDRMWEASPDHPGSVRSVGAWTHGETVVRVRQDRAVAYRIADGEPLWTYTPPRQDTVCAMSGTPDQGVGLVGHSSTDEDCTTVDAVDLRTGNTLWTRRFKGETRTQDTADRAQTAVSGDFAVIREQGLGRPSDLSLRELWMPGSVRALGLRDGRQRWRHAAGPGCEMVEVTGGPAVAVVEDCGSKGVWSKVLRPADGHLDTRVRLPMTGRIEEIRTLSVRPLVLWVKQEGQRGTDTVLSYDAQARTRAAIAVSNPDFELQPAFSPWRDHEALPARSALVHAGRLFVTAVRPDDTKVSIDKNGRHSRTTGRITAYSLADGRREWTTEFDGGVNGIAPDRRSIVAITSRGLIGLAAHTGKKLFDSGSPKAYEPAHLWVQGNRYVVVREDGATDEKLRPVSVFGREPGPRPAPTAPDRRTAHALVP